MKYSHEERMRLPFPKRMRLYRKGGDGFGAWVEDNVCIPIYPVGSDIPEWTPVHALSDEINPETGRSYRHIWEEQKKVAIEALEMKNGRFVHRRVIFCWMRGEGKSLFACLIQIWKFFCWPRQFIVLGANSKDQTKFVHYDIIKDIILNSPNLVRFLGGSQNVQEKEIKMRDRNGTTGSFIRAISSFSGIVSNITGYTFSEIFDMKNPKFFVQLDGSIRNMPNALGVIDSTVSDKSHVLYKMYTSYRDKKDPLTYFSHRCSPTGSHHDFWNPNMTQAQLDSYRETFPFGEFERYFHNSWEAGAKRVFRPADIEMIYHLGVDRKLCSITELKGMIEVLKTNEEIIERSEGATKPTFAKILQTANEKVQTCKQRLWPVAHQYKLRSLFGPQMAQADDLARLGDLFNTDWALLAGFDRNDPMKVSEGGARSVFTLIAKGLPGSRGRMVTAGENEVLNYIYIMMHLAIVRQNTLEGIKELLNQCHEEFDGIDTLCSERWGTWDLAPWAEENGVYFEAISPTYERQKAMFSELHAIVTTGRFKSPPTGELGYTGQELLREEFTLFDHDVTKKWFGSPEKDTKTGVQDDALYSLGWGIYGGRNFGPETFRVRKGSHFFGTFVKPTGMVGNYKSQLG